MKEYTGSTVKIMSCSKCNFKCSHCYIGYDSDFDSDELYNLVDQLRKKYKVKINGTEPLLNKNYLKSFDLAGEDIILTNGLVFKNNLSYIDEIAKTSIKRICISYHFGIHDLISKVSRSFIETLIPEVRKRGLDL